MEQKNLMEYDETIRLISYWNLSKILRFNLILNKNIKDYENVVNRFLKTASHKN